MTTKEPSNGEAPSEERRKAQKHGDEHMNNTQEYRSIASLVKEYRDIDREIKVLQMRQRAVFEDLLVEVEKEVVN